jgi:two-component system chemotaxis response regulator CheY
VVDDSRTVKALIAKALDMSGIEMGTLFKAEHGREALDILGREKKMDLVLADINMPVMGGVELVKAMKADEALRGIPVVIISTEGSAARIGELQAMGISAFLRKPFQPENFKKTVEAVLEASHG